jgi:hypothetical protein
VAATTVNVESGWAHGHWWWARLSGRPATPRALNATAPSWMNLVEIVFGIITRQAIRRGTFTSVPDLIGAIRAFIDAYNERSPR